MLTLCSELKSFPALSHWFCPKRRDSDPIDYSHPVCAIRSQILIHFTRNILHRAITDSLDFKEEAEEDMSPETKHELIHDSKRRHKVAYKYSIILGLNPADTAGMTEEYTDNLTKLLVTCDKCALNWHMGRKAFIKELSE